MKFKDVLVNVTARPVFIVGQNPGRQRKDQQTHRVWEGNRSGDYLMDIIERFELSNVFLTNACNYQQWTDEHLAEGIDDLELNIQKYQPRRIICLGKKASDAINFIMMRDNVLIQHQDIIELPHPSFILRFNKDKTLYESALVNGVLL